MTGEARRERSAAAGAAGGREGGGAGPRGLAILGSTGSVGRQTLEVVGGLAGRWRVVALAARRNADLLAEQARLVRPDLVALLDEAAAGRARELLAPLGIRVAAGAEGLLEAATHPEAALVVSALVGAAGLLPTHAALRAGKDVALANKETLVTAGHLVMDLVRRGGVRLLPVDSEHSAAFQCLQAAGPVREGERPPGVRRLLLTASGGPFRGWDRERLARATPAQALRHPTWRMGDRITVDSATLMNKGLEVIEAHWLFGLDYDAIEVLVHPESLVHALVEMEDGALLAHLSLPDMRLPIQYALTHPERVPSPVGFLDLARGGGLHFEAPDLDNFPCLELARAAGRTGGTAPAVLNAANEVAVAAFLQGRIGFLSLPEVINMVMSAHRPRPRPTLSEILEADAWAREEAGAWVERMKGGKVTL